MKRSAWVVTVVLMALALLAAWFFGLDDRHAVVLVGSACAAGIANGILEHVDLRRPTLTPVTAPSRGLADVQALEFSLAGAEPGTRGVLELQGIGRLVARARPGVPLSEPLSTFLAFAHPRSLTHREMNEHLAEVERLAGSSGTAPLHARPTNLRTTEQEMT